MSDKLTQSARGQPCAFRIPGVCNGNWETTVFCHDRRGWFGAGSKPPSHRGAFGCHACHDVMDRRAKMPDGKHITAEDAGFYWSRAKDRTLDYWFESGVVVVA